MYVKLRAKKVRSPERNLSTPAKLLRLILKSKYVSLSFYIRRILAPIFSNEMRDIFLEFRVRVNISAEF